MDKTIAHWASLGKPENEPPEKYHWCLFIGKGPSGEAYLPEMTDDRPCGECVGCRLYENIKELQRKGGNRNG